MNVTELFTLTPSSVLNVRNLRRGDTARQTLDLTPAEGRDAVELLSVELGSGAQLTYADQPLDRPTGSGRRILFTVSDDAPLGPVSTHVTIRVKVGEIERAREIRIRGEVVGDLTCQPKIVSDTRHKS